MTTLLLARHGETDWNRELRIQGSSDIALNELGHEQARKLAAELADVPLDAIYSIDRAACRKHALTEFSAKRMVDKYEAIYERLIKKNEGTS